MRPSLLLSFSLAPLTQLHYTSFCSLAPYLLPFCSLAPYLPTSCSLAPSVLFLRSLPPSVLFPRSFRPSLIMFPRSLPPSLTYVLSSSCSLASYLLPSYYIAHYLLPFCSLAPYYLPTSCSLAPSVLFLRSFRPISSLLTSFPSVPFLRSLPLPFCSLALYLPTFCYLASLYCNACASMTVTIIIEYSRELGISLPPTAVTS